MPFVADAETIYAKLKLMYSTEYRQCENKVSSMRVALLLHDWHNSNDNSQRTM